MKTNTKTQITGRTTGLATAGAALGAAMVLSMCGCQKAAPPPLAPPMVEVMQINTTSAPAFFEIIGQLDSPQNVEIRARVEAFVDKALFTEGTEVKEGDPLFQLDDKPYKERLAAAKGLLGEAKAALKKYETDVARLTPLAEKRAITRQDLDNALSGVEVGKASVVSAEARVESAMLELSYCDVRAPASGLIGARQVSIGDLVGKGVPTLMATISTLDPIWFYCNVSEGQYLNADTKSRTTGRKVSELPVALVLSDGTMHPDQGKFVFIDRAVDAKTGTLRVRAAFPNPTKVLRPGMFTRIKVDLGVRPDSILVPERAVAELQGKNFVWVIGPGNKATQRPVKAGDPVGADVLILEGLKAGDRVVVEGLQKVREGVVVNPIMTMQTARLEPVTETPTGATSTTKE